MKNHRWIRVALCAFLLACMGAGAPVAAQTRPPGGVTELAVENDDDHMMLTWLSVTLNDYANAMTKWLVDAAQANGGRVTVSALQRFQRQLSTATFAYFEYRYNVDGVAHSRVYLAASGRPFATYINPRSTGLVPPAAPDSDYFNADDVIRHASAGTVEESDVRAHPNQPRVANRENDAEIKVLQSILRDIRDGVVESHGSLLGFVSKRPCDSCSSAMRQFSLETGSEVHVNYVHGANEDGMRTPAWVALRQAREAIANDLVSMLTAPVDAQPGRPEHPSDNDIASSSVCPGN